MPKKYIAYRYFNNLMFWNYERIELSEKELEPYIEKHLGELKNIEIFTRENKIKLEINVNIKEDKDANRK